MVHGQGGKVAHADGVAVGLATGYGFSANVAACARFVVNDDGLTQDDGHGLGHLP